MRRNILLGSASVVILVILIMLLVFRSQLFGAPCPAPTSPNSSFVYRCGIRFCLDNHPFYFAGANSYDFFTFGDGNSTASSANIENRFIDKSRIDAKFTNLQNDHVSVVRLWMFSHEDWHGFEPHKGVYSEPEFMLFDYVIQSAKAHNIRLLPVFEDFWEYYGGIDSRLSWEGLPTGIHERWRFFNKSQCPGCFASYQNYVKYALNRVNHYSGVAYKDDPTIFGWELMNEPIYVNAPTDERISGTTLRAWVDEMGSFVKSIDPNHLLDVGIQGHGSKYDYGQDEGAPFVYVQQSPYIDFTSAHIYPEDAWSKVRTQLLVRALINDSHQAVGKPFFMGEFNVTTDRAGWWQALYSEMEISNGDGSAFWWYEDRDVDSKYGVMEGAPELNVFRQHSLNMQTKDQGRC